MIEKLSRIYSKFTQIVDGISDNFLGLMARIAVAVPFFNSGQSKLEGEPILGLKWNIFAVKESKKYLFQYEFGFPEAIAPAMTHGAAIAENLLPIALVLGLAARLSAMGLMAMTLVIQFYVFPDQLLRWNGNWSLHLLWLMPLTYILARGPGNWSADRVLQRRLTPQEPLLGKSHSG
ncbi:MAG: DoxX family protein [Alphaproteobacteria bacterium]|nr:MAG: DoxX family protein [Alphaproteobacteria bacterium]